MPVTLIGLAQALDQIGRARFRRPRVLEVPTVFALGRRAALALRSPRSVPAERRSAMDGYAVRPSLRAPKGPYRLRGTVFPSGPALRRALAPGDAAFVTTGSPVPPGTVAVVRIESARREGDQVYLGRAPEPGGDILEPGESVAEGDLLVEPGQRLRPVDLGALIGVRRRSVPVYRLRVAILPVGDELVRAGSRSSRRVPEFIGPVIAGMLGGCTTELSAPLPDDEARVASALLRARRRADLILTIGGSSVGPKDVTKAAIASVGRLLFEGVAVNVLKRGAVGLLSGVPVVVLPGQFVSAVTTYHTLGLRVLSRLVDRELVERGPAVLREPLRVGHRMDSVYLFREVAGGVAPLPWGVARTTALLRATSFGVLEHGRRYRAGDRIEVERLWGAR